MYSMLNGLNLENHSFCPGLDGARVYDVCIC